MYFYLLLPIFIDKYTNKDYNIHKLVKLTKTHEGLIKMGKKICWF